MSSSPRRLSAHCLRGGELSSPRRNRVSGRPACPCLSVTSMRIGGDVALPTLCRRKETTLGATRTSGRTGRLASTRCERCLDVCLFIHPYHSHHSSTSFMPSIDP